MLEPLPHADDFLLAQKCLEGDSQAIRQLQETYQAPLMSYLVHVGADAAEARMLVSDLWADCIAPRPQRKPRLATYSGNAPLQAWLKTVVFNNLLQLKRRPPGPVVHEDEDGPSPESPDNTYSPEKPVLDIILTAIQASFQECDPEEFLLLNLAHANGLRGRELAPLFGCSEAKISRTLDASRAKIKAAILRHVKERDEWLEIQWEDFVELCRVVSPSCFGLE
ncbi:MAG TPA: sigma-70 family RNA polymerase sigma factor [Chthoniobacter sp.]|jgi:DNA-directed RNA polymerase specialized sigma24 family protein